MSLLHISKKISMAAVVALALNATSLSASSCDRRAFNIQVNDVVTLNEMLTQLSDVCKFSVVAKDAVAAEELNKPLQGVSIKDLSLREIFNLLITENNLDYSYKNGALKISALQTKTFKVDYITSVREATAVTKSSVDANPVELGEDQDDEAKADNQISTTEKFDFWAKIGSEITSILNNGSEKYIAAAPIVNQNAGLVTVTGTRSQIRRVAQYINSMQKRLEKQVMLDVSIISVELSNDYTTGVDWSKFQLGFSSYLGSNGNAGHGWGNQSTHGHQSGSAWKFDAGLNFNLGGAINFLETKGKTKIVSSPKVTTLNNQPAIVSVGDTINYLLPEDTSDDNSLNGETKTTYKQYSTFIGILLNILPEISDDNRIMLRINPSLSNFKYGEDNERQVDGRKMAPDTVQKKISSVVWCDSGDTIVLGGLIGHTKGKDNNGVPVLRDIPLIGNLFKSTHDNLTTTELIFIITPRIIQSSNVPVSTSLKDLGYSKSLYDNE